MLDINFIRENPDLIANAMEKKRVKIERTYAGVSTVLTGNESVKLLLEVDQKRRELKGKIDAIRAERNRVTQSIKESPNEQKTELVKKASVCKKELEALEPELEGVETDFNDMMLIIPNVPSADVPVGVTDEDNLEIRRWGDKKNFDFQPRDHIELGELLDIIDIPRGVKIAGSRNYYLKNEGILLELAVLRFALDTLVKKGFTPFIVPLMVKDEAMVGTGFFPGGEEQAYRLERDKLNLIGTSEVSLASYHANEVLNYEELPKLYVGLSNCFRREAGTYGKDTRGLYRVHQFQKIEQVVLCENSEIESRRIHNLILNNSEEILKALNLPHRVVIVCTAEMGQGQVFKNDIETWMPSRNNYSETHSCSTLHEFQSRRLNIRYKKKSGEFQYVHTLNNTAIASPRILIPILENYQQKDGSVIIPDVLRPYMDGKSIIKPK